LKRRILYVYVTIGTSRSSAPINISIRSLGLTYSHYISFPSHSFPSEIKVVYRPPQAVKDAHIAKITSCDDTFAALSSSGEVFTFSVPSPSEVDASGKERTSIKPQRVWALRKQFSGVRVRA
jgi:hypothetical protein